MLLDCLMDPANETKATDVLTKLLHTSFVHAVDAASLALVCPILARAMKDRSSEVKKKASQIVGSIVLLIQDPKDVAPYLGTLLPMLKTTLVDPIPDVRATAAKAFGTLCRGLPESAVSDLVPSLVDMLCSEESQVVRSGAANGLAEVLMAYGDDRVHQLMPEILANAGNPNASVAKREGYIGLFIFLPMTMKSEFVPLLEQVLPVLVPALSD